MNTLRYSARLERCAVLGPGNRAILWVFGCCFSCKGCIGERYKTGRSLETTPQEAAEWYLRQNADGLTISGGEPMLQADALSETIGLIRAARDCGVIVYTGFVYEELLKKHDPDINRFLGQIDLLIDGPYIQDLDYNRLVAKPRSRSIRSLLKPHKMPLNLWILQQIGETKQVLQQV